MRKAHSMLLSIFGLLIGFCFQVNAQVGTCSGCLDATFGSGGNGLVATNIGSSSNAAAMAFETVTQNGVPVQKIVAAVQVSGSSSYFAVARYNMDGSLDTTFNGSGLFVTNVIGYIYAVAVQSDGKILLGGNAIAVGVTLVRVNTDGSLDTSFGSGGMTVIPNPKKSSVGMKGMQVQNDAKIVVGGNLGSVGTVWRFMPNGTSDTTFGSGGAASISFGSGSTMFPRAVSLQNVTVNGTVEQMIVTCGSVVLGNGKNQHSVFALLRLTPSGQVDMTFGSGGVISTNFPGLPLALTIDSSNRIVAVGEANTTGAYVVAAARYNANGSADTSFGSNGYTSFPILTNSHGYAVALQSDDKIVIGGPATNTGSPLQMFVARLTTTGVLDGNFGTGGYAIPNFSSFGDNEGVGYAVLVQPADGKIVLGGGVAPSPSGVGLARYWP